VTDQTEQNDDFLDFINSGGPTNKKMGDVTGAGLNHHHHQPTSALFLQGAPAQSSLGWPPHSSSIVNTANP